VINMNRLVELRKEKKMTQKEIASEIGIARTTYVRYENGEIQPPLDMIIKLSTLFNCSTDYLLNNEQKKEPLSNREEQEKDLSKQLDEILLELELQADGLMFSGQALDDRTKEALIISLRNAMELAEAMNKKETDSN